MYVYIYIYIYIEIDLLGPKSEKILIFYGGICKA